MEKQYSVQFFTSFVEHLQDVCRNYLEYSQFVEVSGYVSVEIDNIKKERYVLSELLQRSGNVVSESYCTKAFKTARPINPGHSGENVQPGARSKPWLNRNNSNAQGSQENVHSQNPNRRRSWADSSVPEAQSAPPKVRRTSEVIEIIDDNDKPVPRRRENSKQYYQQSSNMQQGQRWSAGERTNVQRPPQKPLPISRPPVTQIRHPGQYNPMPRSPYGQMGSQEQQIPLPRSAVSASRQQPQPPLQHQPHPQPQRQPHPQLQRQPQTQLQSQTQLQGQTQDYRAGRVPTVPGSQTQKAVRDLGNIEQFNVLRPPPSPVANAVNPPAVNPHAVNPPAVNPPAVVKSEFYPDAGSRNVSPASTLKPEQRSCAQNANVQSPVSATSLSQNSGGGNQAEQTSSANLEVDKIIKTEPKVPKYSSPSGFDEDEIIDLDLFDDDFDDIQSDVPTKDDQSALAKDYGMPGDSYQRKDCPVNRGTQKVVAYAVKLFQGYHFNKSGSEVDVFAIEPERLDDLLLDFYKGARKMNGEELNARTLKNVQIHLDMYLREKGYCHSIAKDEKFKSSRDFVKGRLDSYVATQKFIAVDDNDIEILFQKGVIGSHSPDAIFNGLWFLNTKYFAIRRPVEHYNLKWGDIQIKTDDSSLEYLERRINNMFSLKMFAKPNNPNRCFVSMYKKYWQLRPKESLYENCPFYLNKGANSCDMWFVNEAMTWSRFQNMWRKLAIAGGLSQNKKIL